MATVAPSLVDDLLEICATAFASAAPVEMMVADAGVADATLPEQGIAVPVELVYVTVAEKAGDVPAVEVSEQVKVPASIWARTASMPPFAAAEDCTSCRVDVAKPADVTDDVRTRLETIMSTASTPQTTISATPRSSCFACSKRRLRSRVMCM